MPLPYKLDPMEKYEKIGVIPMKDVDSVNRSLFLKAYVKVLFLLSPFAGFGMGIIGIWSLLLWPIVSLLTTASVMFILEHFSSGSINILFGATKPNIPVREQMHGVLKTARFAKMHRDYPKALKIVNEILKKDPEYHDALFVKAQILYQGFDNSETAKKYCKMVIHKAEPGQTIHTWASSLYEELCQS